MQSFERKRVNSSYSTLVTKVHDFYFFSFSAVYYIHKIFWKFLRDYTTHKAYLVFTKFLTFYQH